MDRALDEVVRERQQNNRNRNQRRIGGGGGGGGGGGSGRDGGGGTPRGGIRKPVSTPRNGAGNGASYDEGRLWVHDKFETDASEGPRRGAPRDRDAQAGGRHATSSAKVKVENIHYELGEDELLDLFRRQGPVVKLDLLYDRAGRSEGIAYVTYAREEDAESAINEYDGALAHGQPISLTFVASRAPPAPAPRSLFDRITEPVDAAEPQRRARSADDRRDPTRKPTPPGIDRYVPPERRRERERGERGERGERTQTGPRSAGGRERGDGGRGGRRGGRGGEARSTPRPKKTVEELDAEMNDYFGAVAEEPAPAPLAAPAHVDEDEDMIL